VLKGLPQKQLPTITYLSTAGPQAKRWRLGHHHIPHFEEKVASGDHMVGVRSGIGNVECAPHWCQWPKSGNEAASSNVLAPLLCLGLPYPWGVRSCEQKYKEKGPNKLQPGGMPWCILKPKGLKTGISFIHHIFCKILFVNLCLGLPYDRANRCYSYTHHTPLPWNPPRQREGRVASRAPRVVSQASQRLFFMGLWRVPWNVL